VCSLILADRGIVIDYNFARRLVNGVLRYRQTKLKEGHSVEKVGQAVVNSDLIATKSKGKIVAQTLEKIQGKPTKLAAKEEAAPSVPSTPELKIVESAPAPAPVPAPAVAQPVVHSRATARYGR
jgi:hypothetical protein